MRIMCGGTRFVVLISGYAIKIARFNVFRMVAQLYRRTRSGTVSQGLVQFHGNKVIAGLRYIFGGVRANLVEVDLSKNYPDIPLAPVLFSFFGFVNVQKRGEPVSQDEHQLFPLRNLGVLHDNHGYFAELNEARQFARFGEKILLIDGGNHLIATQLQRLYGRREAKSGLVESAS